MKPDENNRAEVMKNMSKEEPMESEGSECSGFGIELLMYHALNAVKVCFLQYNLLDCKEYEEAVKYKAALDAFAEVVEDIYDYENYGFFSTTVHVKKSGLPCNIRCGCDREWSLEPYLDGQQKPRFAEVIRFENRRGREPGYDRRNDLCMTISDTPEILEGRDKCVLSDDEIRRIKDFVITNREAILAHARGETDSCEFQEACRKNGSPL